VSRVKKPGSRCEACFMRLELCICSHIADCKNSLKMGGQVSLLIHHRELGYPTNTGRLAHLCLPNSRMLIRGRLEDKGQLAERFIEKPRLLFLYPNEESQFLEDLDMSEMQDKGYQLIVPDGSWRQASKIAKREGFEGRVTFVGFRTQIETKYQLRNEPKVGGMATMEAVAHALKWLESPDHSEKLLKVFYTMVERTMNSRKGQLQC